MLTQQQGEEILRHIGLEQDCVITPIKQHNHVYRIESDEIIAYLKTYTKDWYGDNIAATAGCVEHEAATWGKMAEAGLGAPDVLVTEMSCDNPFGRPFIMTRALKGTALTELVQNADPQTFDALLKAVGAYLRRMHDITFEYPGYISANGPNAPLDPNQWQHYIWTFERFQQEAQQNWSADRQNVPAEIIERAEAFYAQYAYLVKQDYAPPRFIHGDCHASQFFLYQNGGHWQVSGVVDMEVSSAGDFGADFLKFGIEMAGIFPAESRWWEGLFDGYGHEPSFEAIKVRMLAAHHINYSFIWPGTRTQILKHLLDANDWQELYDLRDLS